MGVNMAGFCIYDDAVAREASCREILRRYYHAQVAIRQGEPAENQKSKLELLMQQLGVTDELCPAIEIARAKAEATEAPAGAMVLPNGKVVTGKTSSLLGPCAALLLNALKSLAGIPKHQELISPQTLEPICQLKIEHQRNRNPRLHSDEVMIALSISSVTNPSAAAALAQVKNLKGCDAHFTVIPSSVDEKIYKKLGINVTCEPKYQVYKLYHG